ncbi:hypothetical protein Pcinc_011130 [Petrolisthes cinctipes]|uniref:Uncharacterized protein n=1 Tax=Petrolisthes cinctipes TaxID=88211 RepID=A0AAE1KTR6_PETCI|nr:hypothetical protein Pcinc_011130 [Petrolisthes cinctipes]
MIQFKPKPGDSCDSPGSVALQYDQPANLRFDDTIPGYACTQHSWVLDQYSQGLTDCHFVLDYEIDFYGMDTSYNGQVSYYEAFKHCESVDCVGLVCRKGGSGESSCVLSRVFKEKVLEVCVCVKDYVKDIEVNM